MAGRYDYIAVKPACGCVVALAADMPEIRRDVDREIARWVRAGYRVERVPVHEAVERFAADGCPHKIAQPELGL